jgi:N-acetylmuramoyl-L-alanine amidase
MWQIKGGVRMSYKIKTMVVLFILFLYMTSFIVWGHEYTSSDIVSIGKVAYHEANNQSELGKRLVIDTILNRVESDGFPNTIEEVLSQPGQYCNPSKYPPKDYYRLVAEESYFRTNSDVLWYRTKKYHKYGAPIIKEGDHYFSGR